jgi:hypothetical protein
MSAEAAPDVALLATAEDSTEATVWKAILEGEGIPCWIRNSDFLAVLQRPLPYGNSVEVYVPGSAVEAARELLGIREQRRIRPRKAKATTVWFSWTWLLLGSSALIVALLLALQARFL